MKIKLLSLFCVIILAAGNIKGQIDVSAGMGLSFFNSPSLQDYININFAPYDNNLGTFSSSGEFYLEAAYPLTPDYQAAFLYSIQLFSYNTASGRSGFYEMSLTKHKPFAVAYYLLTGNGYRFKFGGGIGLTFASFEEQIANSPVKRYFTAVGPAFILNAEGHTLLSGNLYAVIGGTLCYELTGELSDGDLKLRNNVLSSAVDLHSLSAAFKLGISYFF